MLNVDIVIPTKNEAGNIAELVRRIKASLNCNYEIIVVDDSIDETPELARKLRCNVVEGRGLGLAQAVIDGIQASLGDSVIVLDADLQHPPELLPEIVDKLKIHDLVVVSKHTDNSHSELSLWRKIQSNLGCYAAKMLVPVSDPMTGYFGIRRECLDGVSLEGIGFKIGLEIFCKANWTSHCELPMQFARRNADVSKGTAQSLQKHLWKLYKSSLQHRIMLPKGSEEWVAFYEGNKFQKKWKQGIALILQKISNEIKPKRTLDLGCGSSPNLNYITGERVGMDIRADVLAFMRKHSDAHFAYGNVRDIPFDDSSFDYIMCIEVLEHLYGDEADKAVSEIARVLKPDGYATIATPNYSSPIWNLIENIQRVIQPGHWTSDHHTRFSLESLTVLCHKYGLVKFRYDGIMGNSDMVITYKKKVSNTEPLIKDEAILRGIKKWTF